MLIMKCIMLMITSLVLHSTDHCFICHLKSNRLHASSDQLSITIRNMTAINSSKFWLFKSWDWTGPGTRTGPVKALGVDRSVH